MFEDTCPSLNFVKHARRRPNRCRSIDSTICVSIRFTFRRQNFLFGFIFWLCL